MSSRRIVKINYICIDCLLFLVNALVVVFATLCTWNPSQENSGR